MTCPNCGASMNDIEVDNQHILHCDRCGGSFFDENEINRVSARSAVQILDSRLKIQEENLTTVGVEMEGTPGSADGAFSEGALTGGKSRQASTVINEQVHPNFCPKDHGVLLPLHNEETIPHNINLLQCTECQGVFATPDNLLKFKQAQEAKVEYFRLWGKPLPSLHAVLLLSFFLVISIAAFASFSRLTVPQTTHTQAEETVTRFSATASGRYIIITFRTDRPYSSQITLINKTSGEQILKEISKEPVTTHLVTLTDLNPQEEYTYRLRLVDEKGKVTEIEEKNLLITK